ncbi:MAG: MBL fold metallo-hydrolase, partial [Lachnospiraceae bacterium]
MKLTFIGAAHEVTGSCHLLETNGKIILIDCGMEQGVDLYENQELPISSSEIDYILLTHAHIDHSGMIPLMCKQGFKGQIITTYATTDLCKIMLLDSAHIQEFEAEWHNRKAKRSGAELYEPIYTMQDAKDALELLIPCPYGERIDLSDGIQVRFIDVGHLLGSASIEIWMKEDDIEKKIVFSGDVGNRNQPIIKNPSLVKAADYVVIESTYGNRLHGEEIPDYVGDFTRILTETFDRGGNVVIPAFAVGRTQEMLYFIREIKEKNLVSRYPDFQVYVDSPLAIEATHVFTKNMRDCFDEEAMSMVNQGKNPLVFPGLRLSIT